MYIKVDVKILRAPTVFSVWHIPQNIDRFRQNNAQDF